MWKECLLLVQFMLIMLDSVAIFLQEGNEGSKQGEVAQKLGTAGWASAK